jgi:hypothetical protein
MAIDRQYQAAFQALNQKLTISLYPVNNTNVISHPNTITVLLLKSGRHREIQGILTIL